MNTMKQINTKKTDKREEEKNYRTLNVSKRFADKQEQVEKKRKVCSTMCQLL